MSNFFADLKNLQSLSQNSFFCDKLLLTHKQLYPPLVVVVGGGGGGGGYKIGIKLTSLPQQGSSQDQYEQSGPKHCK